MLKNFLFIASFLIASLDATGQSFTKLRNEYKRLSKGDYKSENELLKKQLGLRLLESHYLKFGANHQKTREFFIEYIANLADYKYYYEPNGYQEIDSLVIDFFERRNKYFVLPEIDEYGYLIWDKQGDGYSDFLHILTNILGQQYPGIASSFPVDSTVLKLSKVYLENITPFLNKKEHLLYAEELMLLNMMVAAQNRGTNVFDSQIEEIKNLLMDADFNNIDNSDPEFIPFVSFLLQYYIINEYYFQANELLRAITKDYENFSLSGNKEFNPFHPVPKNINDSFWNYYFRIDYQLIFNYLQESRLFKESVIYSNLLIYNEGLNNHYIYCHSFYETQNYHKLIDYWEREVNVPLTLNDYPPAEMLWRKYAPKITPDDLPIYPLAIRSYYEVGDIELASRIIKDFVFYLPLKVIEKGTPSVYSDWGEGNFTSSQAVYSIHVQLSELLNSVLIALENGHLEYSQFLLSNVEDIIDLIPYLCSGLREEDTTIYFIKDVDTLLSEIQEDFFFLKLRHAFMSNNASEFNLMLSNEPDRKEKILTQKRSAFNREFNEYAPPTYWLEFMSATNYLAEGNYFDADEAFQNSVFKLARDYNSNVNLIKNDQKKFYENLFSGLFFRYLKFAAIVMKSHPTIAGPETYDYIHPAGEAYNLILETKGSSFSHEESVKSSIIGGDDPMLFNDLLKWEKLKAEISNLKSKEEIDSDQNEKLKQLTEIEQNVYISLGKRSAVFHNNLDDKQINWKSIRDSLKTGEMSVEMVRIMQENGEVHYYSFVLFGDSKYPQIHVQVNGNDLENKYYNYYINSIRLKTSDELSYQNYFGKLEQIINTRKEKIKKIYMSGDGVYNKINLNTLLEPESGTFIKDIYIINLLTNTRDLVSDIEGKSAKGRVVLIGNPSFNTTLSISPDVNWNDQTRGIPSFENPSPLPGSEKEVNQIENIMRVNFEVDKMVGDQATESNVKKVSDPYILHIATHGLFADFKNSETPFGALLLAGVSNSEGDVEDGILTSFEAQALRLNNTELVVLSACETGLTESTYGGGIQGLQRSFLIAGARNLIMSLWKVDDLATSKLMIYFYNELLYNSTEISFSKAQDKLKEEFPQPYYWGSFVLVK